MEKIKKGTKLELGRQLYKHNINSEKLNVIKRVDESKSINGLYRTIIKEVE